MGSVFFYISGHGFGHASRQIEIINAFGARAPHIRIAVRSSVARWLIERTVRVPVTILPGECDTGAVQIDSLRLDERATVERAAAFTRELGPRAAAEAELLAQGHARLVISDAPPLACAAAALARIPSFVVSNFTWDWIYEGYGEHLRDAPDLVPAIQNAYRQASAAWRLPMHGGFETFDRVVDAPFVARHARRDPEHVRRTLGLPPDRPLVLFSFGGLGIHDVDLTTLDCLDRCDVVMTGHEAQDVAASARAGVHVIGEPVLYGAGLRYEDLVGACDVVLTKPGYGIVSECIANGTAILYTSRGRFVEYDVLVREMPRLLRCGFIDHASLFGGRWAAALGAVLSQLEPGVRPATNGAEAIAGMMLEHF